MKFLRRNQEHGEWVDYALDAHSVHSLRFSVNPGSALERAWNSTTHAAYLGRWHRNVPLDLLFVTVPVWQLHTNIPSRTIRLVRHDYDIQNFYIQDILAGTWQMTNPTIM